MYRALMVEDDKHWQELLVEMLEELDFAVRHAASYEAALEMMDDGPYDLALLDVSLAASDHDNQDGLRVLEQFRARYPHAPTVVLTGYATVDLAVQALTDLDATDFLRKERFDRRRFRETIQRVLGGAAPRPPASATTPLAFAPPAPTDPLDARILVVEDNAAWQSIYHELLSEVGAEMALAVSYGEARGLLQRGHFDAAVVDLKLASSTEPHENRDGSLLLRLTHDKGLPTLVVSALGEPTEIDKAYETHGIFAFFDKEGFQRTTFLQTLREAVANAAGTAPGAPAARDAGPLADLTDRQMEVLALVAQGLTNNEIAEELVVSVNTVKKHVLAIFGTLGVNTRAAAAAIAARHGAVGARPEEE